MRYRLVAAIAPEDERSICEVLLSSSFGFSSVSEVNGIESDEIKSSFDFDIRESEKEMKPASSSCMEDTGLVNGGSQKSTVERGVTLRIKMKRSRDQIDDVDAVSSRESATLSDHSTRVGDDRDDVVVGEHECKVCSKSFSSGRALAGHMRVDGGGAAPSPPSELAVEAQRGHPDSNEDDDSPAASKRKISSTTAVLQVAVCPLCKKEFPSMKSLFGHMRCHPDRDWRGIQPPEKLLSSPSSTVSNSESKPGTRISSCPVTSRRKKMRTMEDSETGRAESDAFPNCDDPIFEAAHNLLLLKYSTIPLAAMDLSPANDSKLGGKKRKKKKKMIGDLMDRLEKYRCNTCNKTFASHQALGGHRTSHRKDHLVTNIAEDDRHLEGDDDEEEEGEEEEEETPRQKRVELASPLELDGKELQTHECKICHKCFPSGQALGGHKRCHWNEERAAGKLEVAESSSKATTAIGKEEKSTPATGSATPSTISMLDFDLNEVAPVEDLDLHALYSVVEMVPAAAKLLGAQNAAFATNPLTS